MEQTDHLRRIRFWLTLLMVGLVLSGITAFPLQTELVWLVSFLHKNSIQSISESTGLLSWIELFPESQGCSVDGSAGKLAQAPRRGARLLPLVDCQRLCP